MDKISVKMTDMTGGLGSASKSDSSVRAVTDDFRKLLQGQERQADDKEVSKKKDTKTEETPEKTQDTKEVKDTKNEKEETAKDDTVKETAAQTEGLLAAFQMDLGMRPEVVVQTQPETVQEDNVSEIQMEIIPETETEITVPQLQAGQPEVLVETAAPQMTRPETKAETTAPEQPETAVVPETVQKPQASVKNESSPAGKDNSQAQPESHMAEQTAQAPVAQTQPEVQVVKQEEPVRMYVPQSEALPEKVADQLLAKISEGVQEFEIHIEPANLGKIAVKILYQEGQATISVMCSEKRALDVLGRNAGELGQVIEKNLGGTTTIIVDKQESDYLNQQKDENQQNGQDAQQNQQKESKNEQSPEEAEQFLQKLRLGLAGSF